jgi:Tfp pilus assembly protein PilN
MLSLKATFEMLKTGSISPGWLAPLKILRTQTVLGLDISDRQVSLVLLKGDKNGVEMLTCASAPVPEGAMKDGRIKDATVLAKTIKDLKNKSRIRTTRAAVSLFTESVITQIMEIPKQVPGNIGQFVQDQVKHIAVLPANNISSDFCGVAGAGSAGRLFVVAADDRKVDDIVNMCNQADLAVEAIEPPLLAYARALYATKIAGKFDCNVLMAIFQGNNLALCVFRKQSLDFVRTKSIGKEKTQPDELCQWLVEQINTVIQFYDVEVPDSSGKWEITVVADGVQLPQNAEGTLKAKVANADLQIMTNEDICQAVVVNQSRGQAKGEVSSHGGLADYRRTDRPSSVALGLAMRLLGTDTHNLGVNLLPPRVARLRTAQKGTLITANILAAVLLIMILAVVVPEWKIKKLNESISSKKVNLFQNAHALFEKQVSVNKQIDAVSKQVDQINAILDSHNNTDWPGLLNDIKKAIPKTACITNLSSGANSRVSLKGLAKSNETVYWFMDGLNKSERINSASITGTKRDSQGFISYEISCALAPEKGK